MTPTTPDVVDIPDTLREPQSFLSGQAGTGKTYLAKSWAAQEKGVVLAATTGIASVNLGEGTTINALLKYFDTESLIENFTSGALTAQLGKLWRAGVRRIILDEISMMDAEQLTCITTALDQLAGRKYIVDETLDEAIEESGSRVGSMTPIGLTLTGDFAQLPPVKAKFAFESPAWERYFANHHHLTEIRRQADREFIEALQACRRGEVATVCDYFGPRLSEGQDSHFDGTTIVATNAAVDRLNMLRMDRIAGPPRLYRAERWGKQRGDWKLIPEVLPLKVGALVMILANEKDLSQDQDRGAKLLFANGDLGHVEALEDDHAVVKLTRNGKIVTVWPITRNNEVPLDRAVANDMIARGEWQRVAMDDRKVGIVAKDGRVVSEDGKKEIVGTVTYLPLRAAWATTVHKSQGLSFDVLQVNTREGMFTEPGLLYVALSRVRTIDGLRLIGSVDGLRQRCTVHPKVVPWL